MQSVEEVKLFFIVTGLLFFLLIVFIILFILIFKKRQNELLLKNQLDEEKYKNELLQSELAINKKLEKERERISLDIHDDLGASLSAIKLKAEFIQQNTDRVLVNETLDEIIEGTREIALNMREMMWSLTSDNDTVENFIIYAKNYVHQYFERSNIQVSYAIPTLIDDKPMNGYIRRNLFLCIKEICHNILKHSQANKIILSLVLNESCLMISIIDNGIGIATNQKMGNGLHSLHRRIKALKGTITIVTNEKGTEIELKCSDLYLNNL